MRDADDTQASVFETAYRVSATPRQPPSKLRRRRRIAAMAVRIALVTTLLYFLVYATWHAIDATGVEELTAAWEWLGAVFGDVAALAFVGWLWIARP